MINKAYFLVLTFETQCAVHTYSTPESTLATFQGLDDHEPWWPRGQSSPTAPAPTCPPPPSSTVLLQGGWSFRGYGPPSQAILIRSHAVPPPRPAISCRRVSSPLLTHLCLDALRLPDVSDRFQEATLSFCLCHHQTRQLISQVFQATPEPTGLLTGLARKGRRVIAPGHFGERPGEAGGPAGRECHRPRCSP